MKTKIEITQQTRFVEIQKYLVNEIKKLINDDIVEIVTNGNLAAVMQDCIGYDLSKMTEIKIEKSEDGRAKKYTFGTFLEKPLLVDPYMRWDDNRILFKNNNGNIDELEVIDEKMLLI